MQLTIQAMRTTPSAGRNSDRSSIKPASKKDVKSKSRTWS